MEHPSSRRYDCISLHGSGNECRPARASFPTTGTNDVRNDSEARSAFPPPSIHDDRAIKKCPLYQSVGQIAFQTGDVPMIVQQRSGKIGQRILKRGTSRLRLKGGHRRYSVLALPAMVPTARRRVLSIQPRCSETLLGGINAGFSSSFKMAIGSE
jgi:hypothetical protein